MRTSVLLQVIHTVLLLLLTSVPATAQTQGFTDRVSTLLGDLGVVIRVPAQTNGNYSSEVTTQWVIEALTRHPERFPRFVELLSPDFVPPATWDGHWLIEGLSRYARMLDEGRVAAPAEIRTQIARLVLEGLFTPAAGLSSSRFQGWWRGAVPHFVTAQWRAHPEWADVRFGVQGALGTVPLRLLIEDWFSRTPAASSAAVGELFANPQDVTDWLLLLAAPHVTSADGGGALADFLQNYRGGSKPLVDLALTGLAVRLNAGAWNPSAREVQTWGEALARVVHRRLRTRREFQATPEPTEISAIRLLDRLLQLPGGQAAAPGVRFYLAEYSGAIHRVMDRSPGSFHRLLWVLGRDHRGTGTDVVPEGASPSRPDATIGSLPILHPWQESEQHLLDLLHSERSNWLEQLRQHPETRDQWITRIQEILAQAWAIRSDRQIAQWMTALAPLAPDLPEISQWIEHAVRTRSGGQVQPALAAALAPWVARDVRLRRSLQTAISDLPRTHDTAWLRARYAIALGGASPGTAAPARIFEDLGRPSELASYLAPAEVFVQDPGQIAEALAEVEGARFNPDRAERSISQRYLLNRVRETPELLHALCQFWLNAPSGPGSAGWVFQRIGEFLVEASASDPELAHQLISIFMDLDVVAWKPTVNPAVIRLTARSITMLSPSHQEIHSFLDSRLVTLFEHLLSRHLTSRDLTILAATAGRFELEPRLQGLLVRRLIEFDPTAGRGWTGTELVNFFSRCLASRSAGVRAAALTALERMASAPGALQPVGAASTPGQRVAPNRGSGDLDVAHTSQEPAAVSLLQRVLGSDQIQRDLLRNVRELESEFPELARRAHSLATRLPAANGSIAHEIARHQPPLPNSRSEIARAGDQSSSAGGGSSQSIWRCSLREVWYRLVHLPSPIDLP